jgi:metabolite-proton symporter
MALDTVAPQRPDTAPSAEQRRQARLGTIGSTIGNAVEWYDFFLYNTAAALVFPALFFPDSSAYAGRLQAFATYAVGFAARPVGAALFGHFGDRIGRRATLLATLLLMGGSTVLVGLMPGTASIGIWAPVLLVLLRVLQGFAAGGEWSGSVLLAMEWGDQRRRGLAASIPQMGVAFGLILGTGFLYLLSWQLSDEQFAEWGWRIPFLLSTVMVAVGLFIRVRVLETPSFARRVEQGQLNRLPALAAIRRHWRTILLCALARMSEMAPFYVITAFALGYMTHDRGYSTSFALAAIMSAAVVEMAVIPIAGRLSDRFGRRRVYAVGSVLTAVYGFVLFAAIGTGVAWLAFGGVLLALVPHGLQVAPQASLFAESFPTSVRYSGAGLGFHLASVIAGGPAPLVATWLLVTTGSVYAVAGAVVACSVVTLVALALLTDRAGADIDDDAVYQPFPR